MNGDLFCVQMFKKSGQIKNKCIYSVAEMKINMFKTMKSS
jgi:hypothetical protein